MIVSSCGVTGQAPLPEPALGAPLIELKEVGKSFGATAANSGLTFTIQKGDVIGLIGANGAGKSTLMRILAGVLAPDRGHMAFEGATLEPGRFSPAEARALGIRIVHQELSLCDSLSVAENFFLEDPRRAGMTPLWRSLYASLANETINHIFPDSGIDSAKTVGSLSIAQRQMVEIARSASNPDAKLIILDEPTSSLDAKRSADLRTFIAERSAKGVSFIFISHKLAEVKSISSRILIMRGGQLVWQGQAGDVSLNQMIETMASGSLSAIKPPTRDTDPDARILVEIPAGRYRPNGDMRLRAGEIVGLAGLEGNGQREFLHALRLSTGRRGGPISCFGSISFVSGDRVNDGIFPLWDVLRNTSLSILTGRGALSAIRPKQEAAIVQPWLEKTRVDLGRMHSPAVELSGGNQQKVLMSRALAVESDIILLDDPTRGVDVGVKRDFYLLMDEARRAGKLIVWLSSEDTEFAECDRVLVFHRGGVAREISTSDISEDEILSAAFEGEIASDDDRRRSDQPAYRRDWFRYVPFLTTVLVFGLISLLNPAAASMFGIDLLLTAAVPLILVSLAQMFVVGGSEIDLGVGAFIGMVNVLSATLLVTDPWTGGLSLAAGLALQALLGLLIWLRQIPAIVVTLGASFIWLGAGYVLQPSPGGASPEWLAGILNSSWFGAPASVFVVVVATIAAWWFNQSRVGTMLRGFGANAKALQQAGWSPIAAYIWRYGVAGLFTLLAGLCMTAINSGSDVNAGSSYTLLSIAAVVIGGCALAGGKIVPVGVVCGAITLSLIGSLLGFLNVTTDYNAAVQGGLLIGILLLRRIPGVEAP